MSKTRNIRKNRNIRNIKKSRKQKKGGFSFFGSKVVPNDNCNPNNLVNLKTSDELYNNYKQCCPKTFFGSKNSSPYCKQVNLNFQSALTSENNASENVSDDKAETAPILPSVQSAKLPQSEIDVQKAATKPWYQFWGGKSRRRNKRENKRSKTNRHYKK